MHRGRWDGAGVGGCLRNGGWKAELGKHAGTEQEGSLLLYHRI